MPFTGSNGTVSIFTNVSFKFINTSLNGYFVTLYIVKQTGNINRKNYVQFSV